MLTFNTQVKDFGDYFALLGISPSVSGEYGLTNATILMSVFAMLNWTCCTHYYLASSFFLHLESTSVMWPVTLTLIKFSWSIISVNKKNFWFPAIIVSLFHDSFSISVPASLIFMFLKVAGAIMGSGLWYLHAAPLYVISAEH